MDRQKEKPRQRQEWAWQREESGGRRGGGAGGDGVVAAPGP